MSLSSRMFAAQPPAAPKPAVPRPATARHHAPPTRPPIEHDIKLQQKGALKAREAELRETAAVADYSGYSVIGSMYDMRILADMMSDAKYVSLDLETTGLNFRRDKICGMGVCIQEGEAFYIATHHPLDPDYNLPEKEVAELVRPVLENPKIHIVGTNLGNFDSKWWLHHWGADLKEPIDDVQLMYNLLDPRPLEELRLELLVLVRLGYRMIRFEDVVGKDENGKLRAYNEVPLEDSYIYGCEDVDMALRLRHHLAEELSKIPRWLAPEGPSGTFLDYYYDLEDGISRAIRDMEMAGMAADPEVIQEADEKIGHLLADYERKIYPIVGAPINMRSQKQLGHYLFGKGPKTFEIEVKQKDLDEVPEELAEMWRKRRRADELAGKRPRKNYKFPVTVQGLGLAATKRSKKTKAPSTDKEALDLLADKYPELTVLDEIAMWKKLATLKSNFTSKLTDHIDPDTGRIHGTLNQTGVETGRYSMSSPNLQQLPRVQEALEGDPSAEYGSYIRAAFIAPKGSVEIDITDEWRAINNNPAAKEVLGIRRTFGRRLIVPERYLIFSDFSQIELRVAAFYSQDPAMREAYEKGIDIHTMTAAQMFRLQIEEVIKEHRNAAKAINFGIWYGMVAKTLARRLKISVAEAEKLLASYLAAYTGVKEYAEQSAEFGRRHGGIQTMLGRWRWSGIRGHIRSGNKYDRMAAERKCMNTPIQGSAAELMKLAMLNIHQNLVVRGKLDMIANVHDELGFEIESRYLDPLQAAYLIKGHMELSMGTYSVPEGFDIPIVAEPAVGLSWGKMVEFNDMVKKYRGLATWLT